MPFLTHFCFSLFNFQNPVPPKMDLDQNLSPLAPPRLERSDTENGALLSTTIHANPETLFPDTELSSLRIAVSKAKSAIPELPTYRDMCVSPPPELCSDANELCSHPPVHQESIWNIHEGRPSKLAITVEKMNREIQMLDSISLRLGALTRSRSSEDKELEMISMQLLRLSKEVDPSSMSRRITPTPLSNIIEDLPPSNPLFSHAPVYANQDAYSRSLGLTGTTDQRARERATLSMKRSETKRTS